MHSWRKVASIHKHSNGVQLAGSLISRELSDRNHVMIYLVTSDATYQKLLYDSTKDKSPPVTK